MQLTVLCLLGVAACAYGQIGIGAGIAKSFNVSLLPIGSVQVDKAFGAGIGTNRRRRDANDVPKIPQFLIARRSGISFGVRPRPADGPAANGQRPQGPKVGPGPSRPGLPLLLPIRPQPDESGRRRTSTQSPVSSSSAEPSDESSSAANNEASNESSDESSSQSNSEAGENNESSSPESNEASSDASNESNQ